MKILSDLHDLWESLTGQELKRAPTERLFWEFNNAGFTAADLKTLVTYMQRCNAKGQRYKIQLHKVIGDLEITASILAEASAKERNTRRAKTESEKTLARYENAVEPEEADPRIKWNGRHLSDIIKTIAQ